MNDYVWLTPDPNRVSRFIALSPEGVRTHWVEVYLGEKILVHYSRVAGLKSKGFIESEDTKIYPTMEEAENEN